jgi:antitoxin YefM
MASTYSITEGQSQFPKMVKEAQAGYVATITKRDEPVAYIIGKERMAALIETMEIMANPEAMQTIRDYEAGKLKFFGLEDIRS